MSGLGEWRWYMGVDERDDEMMDCGTRDRAISYGKEAHSAGEAFWIVEARVLIEDEEAMGAGEADSAPFAETRNGEWITVQ